MPLKEAPNDGSIHGIRARARKQEALPPFKKDLGQKIVLTFKAVIRVSATKDYIH